MYYKKSERKGKPLVRIFMDESYVAILDDIEPLVVKN